MTSTLNLQVKHDLNELTSSLVEPMNMGKLDEDGALVRFPLPLAGAVDAAVAAA